MMDNLLDHPIGDRGRRCKFAKQAQAAVGLGYFYPSHRLWPISPALDLLALRWPVLACIGRKILHGHAVNTRRPRRPLFGFQPLPCPRQLVSGQHRWQQVLGGYFVLFQGSVRAGRRRAFPGRGRRCVRGRHRLLLVSRCSALQRPDSWPPTTAFADFCTVTTRVATRRAVRLEGGCCRFFDTQRAARHGAWFLITRLNHPGIATVQSHRSRCRSPQVRTRTIGAQAPH